MNYSRAVGVARFVLVILCIALLMSVAVCGVDAWGLGGIFDDGTVVLGLDLSGGSRITYSAVTDDTGSSLSEGMDSILQAMRTRLDNSGYTEANVYLVGDNMITVEIPGIDDPNEAVKSFGSMGKLTFRNTDGETVLTGEDVAKAQAVYAQTSDGTYEYQVSLSFTEEGSKKFAAATKAAVGKTIAIYMDEELLSKPNVKEEITGGEASISSGNMTLEYAKMLAGNINAGALKYELKLEELRSIGPTLGEKSLQTSLQAGLIGVCLVAVFLIAVYRIPGLMASISMVAYLALFMLCISVFQINLTLPGIAGVVLSVGMAVDANVVVFERMKEEIRGGKSAKAAIKSGYQKAFSAVLDSNVTTFIAAGVLYALGSGTIKGFAITLGLGVVLTFITAVFLTRLLLNLCCDMYITGTGLYGVKERSVQ